MPENIMLDDNTTERPLGLSSAGGDLSLNKDASSLTKDNPRNNEEGRDDTQHMKKMRNKLLMLAGATSYVNHRHRKIYEKAVKTVEDRETQVRSLSNKPGATGAYGRSISEIFAEDNLKREKKQLEKLQKKWPNLQRPQSLKDNIGKATKTMFSGVNQALRSQTMKGVAQSQGGSDTRAMAAASMAGYVPGATETDTSFEL